eukprot:scaffold10205_cov52-Cyclotella_meneghiniana.AAC.1
MKEEFLKNLRWDDGKDRDRGGRWKETRQCQPSKQDHRKTEHKTWILKEKHQLQEPKLSPPTLFP